MSVSVFISKEQGSVLARAREVYGHSKQIDVSAEEMCELAASCLKYSRYSSEARAVDALYDKVLGEVADVIIVLDHIIKIFGMTSEDIGKTIDGKIARLEGWLNESSSSEQTTIRREIPHPVDMNGCEGCTYEGSNKSNPKCDTCGPRLKNYVKALPCNGCRHMGDYANMKVGGVCYVCAGTGGGGYEPIEGAADEAK